MRFHSEEGVQMQYCPVCSSEINAADIMCPTCGAALSDRPGVASKMIAVGSYCSLKEARVNQKKLDSEGIRSMISDNEKDTGQHPYSMDLSGFTLQVDESNVEDAMRILMGAVSRFN